ncbi:MAG: MSMEG_0569 family flavin-dependent oxidoreductase [Candidatus Velthaea sp.]
MIAGHYPVAVIGGGHAGLSMSYLLKATGIEHIVLEKNRIGEAWRSARWETFCLVTPNWQCTLPGFPYTGSDPDGFMKKAQIVDYIEAYAASFEPPVHEGVTVTRLARDAHRRFEIETSAGTLTADQVVVAIGGYHSTALPRIAERFPADIAQLHSTAYRSPQALPPGDVLVVGSGQSGAQIAEDLHLARRRVHLCVGGAPRTARFYRGRDVVAWLHDMGHYDMPVHEHPLKERVREKSNHYVTGRDGGRDIDLRQFARDGMQLYGRLSGVTDSRLSFDSGLEANLDAADRVSESIKTSIDAYIAQHKLSAPVEARYVPVWRPHSEAAGIDLREASISTVIWCVGFGMDFRWIDLPAFDGKGYPVHTRGVSAVPGLYFLGLPWQYTWGSGRFSGVARDAGYLRERIVMGDEISPPPVLPAAFRLQRR